MEGTHKEMKENNENESKRKVLIIANLFHASPRIPGLMHYLQDFGWGVTIISPSLGNDAEILLGFPKGFLEGIKILEVPYRGDIFWYWRRIFGPLGIMPEISSLIERMSRNNQKSGANPLWFCDCN